MREQWTHHEITLSNLVSNMACLVSEHLCLSMGTCFVDFVALVFPEIVDFSTKSSLDIKMVLRRSYWYFKNIFTLEVTQMII